MDARTRLHKPEERAHASERQRAILTDCSQPVASREGWWRGVMRYSIKIFVHFSCFAGSLLMVGRIVVR